MKKPRAKGTALICSACLCPETQCLNWTLLYTTIVQCQAVWTKRNKADTCYDLWSPAHMNSNHWKHQQLCVDLAGNEHSCICMSVCICVCLPVAIPSPPLTPKKGLKGTEAVLSDLWQNPSQIRKLRSFIIAGHGVPRITWECAPKSTARVKTCLFTCRRLSFLIYLHMIYSVSRVVLSDHTEDHLHHHFDDFI